jgi:ABC-type glycerol-3-phosphate transport system substrate-binding protein
MRRRYLLLGLVLLLMPFLVAACGGDDEEVAPPVGETEAADTGAATEPGAPAGGEVSGSVSLMGIWVGDEQANLQAVVDGFTEQNPDVDVNYIPAGDELVTRLSTAVEGGNPPDLATVAQPGLIADLVQRGALKPLEFAREAAVENLGESVVETGSVEDRFYGLLFKAANKSLVWYNVAAYEEAGVEPTETWEDFLTNAETIKASGVPAFAVGGADGWTLTDLFENIYLRQAGTDMYDQLARHEIPWTDQSVKDALTEMAKIVGDPDNIAGGTSGALQTDNASAVPLIMSEQPKAAQYIAGDFVPGVLADNPLEPGTGYNVFPFPAINDSPSAVVGAGDFVVMFNESPAVQAFVEYLASAEAAEIWAARGGFSSANKNVDPAVYPDDILRTTAGAIGDAEVFRFDLSDLQPSAFGGTVGQGLFKLFQDFVRNPDDVDGIAQKMEDAAAKAFG